MNAAQKEGKAMKKSKEKKPQREVNAPETGAAEAGALVGVTGERITQLIRAGHLPAKRVGPRGRWRIRVQDVLRLLSGGDGRE
jgi:excisionase family DNA binding protein